MNAYSCLFIRYICMICTAVYSSIYSIHGIHLLCCAEKTDTKESVCVDGRRVCADGRGRGSRLKQFREQVKEGSSPLLITLYSDEVVLIVSLQPCVCPFLCLHCCIEVGVQAWYYVISGIYRYEYVRFIVCRTNSSIYFSYMYVRKKSKSMFMFIQSTQHAHLVYPSLLFYMYINKLFVDPASTTDCCTLVDCLSYFGPGVAWVMMYASWWHGNGILLLYSSSRAEW